MKNIRDNREHWEPDAELEGVIMAISRLTGGLPDDHDGHPIISHGVGSNCAEQYSNDVFVIRDFCWCDGATHPEDADGIPTCPPNFEHFASGLKAEWYKYLGRDVRVNAEVEVGESLAILMDCAMSVSRAQQYALPQAEQRAAWNWQPTG